MKPYLRRKSDFIKDNPIVEYNDAGILVTRDGENYNIALDLDVDSVIHINTTDNKKKVDSLINEIIPKKEEIKKRFINCRPD